MKSKLLSRIRTVDERDKLLDEVGLLLDSLYQINSSNGVENLLQASEVQEGSSATDLNDDSTAPSKERIFARVLKSKVRFWVSEIIGSEVPNDLNSIEKYLQKIKEDLNAMKVLTLKLAFEPTDITIDKFHDFIKRNVGGISVHKDQNNSGSDNVQSADVILNFEYDPTVLGGAEIKWEGIYRDFSLRRLFEVEYEAQKAEVLKIMYSK